MACLFSIEKNSSGRYSKNSHTVFWCQVFRSPSRPKLAGRQKSCLLHPQVQAGFIQRQAEACGMSRSSYGRPKRAGTFRRRAGLCMQTTNNTIVAHDTDIQRQATSKGWPRRAGRQNGSSGRPKRAGPIPKASGISLIFIVILSKLPAKPRHPDQGRR